VPTSSSSRMRVMNHNWSATKQRLHPQSVAGRRTLRIVPVPLICQWTLGIVDDWGERASGCGRAGRRGVTTASTPSRVV